MEYQVTKPSFVRFNWTQVAITFAACFAACLLAGGAIYAILYFVQRKTKPQSYGNDAQTGFQRPIREEKIHEIKEPQNGEAQNDGEAQNHDEAQNEKEDGQKEKSTGKAIRLNGRFAKKPVSNNPESS